MKKYVLLTAMFLVGCTTTPQDCDLHAQDPSFLTKLSCTTSGGYRQKVNEQEQTVKLSQWENKRAQQDLTHTQNRHQATNQQLTNEQAKLATLRSDLSQTITRLQKNKSRNQKSQQEIQKLQALLKQSQHASSNSEIATVERNIAEAKKRVEALEKANAFN